jgi:hypothetical protein
MLESGTSGTVGGEGGNVLVYPAGLYLEIRRRSPFKARGGRTLHRTQPGHRRIHHVVPYILTTQCDVEVVSDGIVETGFKKNVCKAGTTTSNRIGPISMPPTITVASGR